MPRNVEVKARIEGTLDELIEKIQPLADGPPIKLKQIDTFFNCPNHGRLKLRVEQDRPAHLIYYERNENPFEPDPKVSNYSIVEISHPDKLMMIQCRSTCFQWGFYDPQMSGSFDGTDLVPHDRALTRAYKTKYRNPKMNSSLFIGHIPSDCDENDLKILFPHAKDIHLIRHRITKESKGYAFANGFIDRTKEYQWKQHSLFVENVASNTLIGWKPRRCGGGLGGNKKSGQLRFGGILRPFQKNSSRQFNEDVQQRWKYLLHQSKILRNKSK